MKTISLCNYCGKGRDDFEDEQKFKHHTCRNKTEVSCEDCGKCFASSLILRRHKESVHMGLNHYCSNCGKCFKSLATKIRHEKEHGEKQYACDLCAKKFSRCFSKKFEEKKKHKSSPNEKSSEKSLKCNHCDKEFTRRVSLKRHMKTHFKTQTLLNAIKIRKGNGINANLELYRVAKKEAKVIKNIVKKQEIQLEKKL